MRARAAIVTAAVTAVLWAATAPARSQQTYLYSFEDVYSAAVRLVRIDRGCSITDRDPQAAYILFECKEDKRLHRGALEIFRSETGVRVQLSLLDQPSYLEVQLLDKLASKLREERGPPRRPPAPDLRPARPDGGAR